MKATVLRGDVFDVLPTLSPGSVDCCVTSPPYWQLRSYLPEGHPQKPRELGSEATPAEYVARMVEVFRLVRAVLAPWGTVWLNVGDTYAGGGGGNYGNGKSVKSQGGQQITNVLNRGGFGIAAGNLCLIPWRLAIALQDDEWIVRSVVVWHKPSPMPASLAGWRWCRCRVKVKGQKLATDSKTHTLAGGMANGKPRGLTPDWLATWTDCPGCPGCPKCESHGGYVLRRGSWRATSSWEPVLMLAKGPGYYADGEATKHIVPAQYGYRHHSGPFVSGTENGDGHRSTMGTVSGGDPTAGANLRDVWTIADPLMRLRTDLTPAQRKHVLSRLLAAGL